MRITVKGIDIANKFFDKAISKAEKEMTAVVDKTGTRIETGARSSVPGEFPTIRGSVNKIKGKLPISANIGSNIVEAAYVNFGTGKYARQTVAPLSKDWQNHAWEFYVNGLGRQPAVPFLTNAFEQERPKFIPEIEKGLKKALK